MEAIEKLDPNCRIGSRPLSPNIGAEIEGAVLSRPQTTSEIAALRDLFARHSVLFFRDQTLEPNDLVRFAELFGPIGEYPFAKPLADNPYVIPIIKEAHQETNFGGIWHTDTPYLECPSMASVLYAVQIPPVGGDTLFASGIAAYEALSQGLKDALGKLKIVNLAGKNTTALRQNLMQGGTMLGKDVDEIDSRQAVHPAVRTHPVTGRKSLYVSPAHAHCFEGWSEPESRPLLEYLFNHIAKEEFTCRFGWSKGAVAIWDNRCAFHYPLNDYHGHRREMYRVTIQGDRPV